VWADAETLDVGAERGRHRIEGALVEAREVHLVDRQHQVRDPEQRHHGGVPAGLGEQPGADVDEQDRRVRGRRAGHGVAGVLHVARGVDEDDAAPRGGEVAVRHIDGDALLALGPQPVGEQREVDPVASPVEAGTGQRLDRVGQHGLGVVEEPADQRALPVVDGAGGRNP